MKNSFFQVLDNILTHSIVFILGVLRFQFTKINLDDFDFSINTSLKSQGIVFIMSCINSFLTFIIVFI